VRKLILAFLLLILVSPLCFADTIYLKNGRTIEAEIIEKTDRYIKVDVHGIGVTYWLDEIDRIGDEPAILVDKKVSDSPQAQVKAGRNFLWKVESGTTSAYILGSIHVLKKEAYPLSKAIENAFNESSTLVVEVNINNIDPLEMQRLTFEKATYPANETLSKHISKQTYKIVEDEVESMGLDILQFSNFKPWFLAIALTVSELQNLGYDPKHGVDKYFLDKAQGKKRILELETFDSQIKLLDGFSDYYQELFLLSTVYNIATIRKFLKKLVYAWSVGDERGVEQLLFMNLAKYPKLKPVYEKIFYERNKKMARKIEEFLKTRGKYFVVIGTGHLVGERGIIKSLKDKGYTVEQQ